MKGAKGRSLLYLEYAEYSLFLGNRNSIIMQAGQGFYAKGRYHTFGMVMPGHWFSSSNYRYGYNGQERDNEIAGEGDDYNASFWEYDPRLGRRFNRDPKSCNKPGVSSYMCFDGNPILMNDINGDIADFSKANSAELDIEGKKVSGCEYSKKTVDEWRSQTGLDLYLDDNNLLKSKGALANQHFSPTAREKVLALIDNPQVVEFDFSTSKTSQTEKNTITINPREVDNFVKGVSRDLNPQTISYGLIALHEYEHTTAGGGQSHTLLTLGIFGVIDKPDQVGNKIRSELSEATKTNYGQRSSYAPININGTFYLPFSSNSTTMLQQAQLHQSKATTMYQYFNVNVPEKEVVKFGAMDMYKATYGK